MKRKYFIIAASLIVLIDLSIVLYSSIVSSDYYTEEYRPQFHFTPEENWVNDPNGMVY